MPIHATDSDDDPFGADLSPLASTQAELQRLKRRCASLAEQVNELEERKRKRDTTPPYGRGIPRLVDPYTPLTDIIRDADLHHMSLNGGGDQADKVLLASLTPEQAKTVKQTRGRNHTAVTLLSQFIPSFQQSYIDAPTTLRSRLIRQLEKQASNARSHDTKELKSSVITLLASDIVLHPPVNPNDCSFRRLHHDDIGWLLCPLIVDWKNDKAKVRSGQDPTASLSTSFFCRFMYSNFDGDPENVEKGYLRSNLIVRAYKHIFTSPRSSMDEILSGTDEENIDPSLRKTRKVKGSRKPNANTNNVANGLHMNRVTGRSIAYICMQVHFALSSAPSWTVEHDGFNCQAFYYFLVDYFEDPDPDCQVHIRELLDWWTRRVFPNSLINAIPQNTVSESQKIIREQRASRK